MSQHNIWYRTGGKLHSMSVMKFTTLLRKLSDQHLREPACECECEAHQSDPCLAKSQPPRAPGWQPALEQIQPGIPAIKPQAPDAAPARSERHCPGTSQTQACQACCEHGCEIHHLTQLGETGAATKHAMMHHYCVLMSWSCAHRRRPWRDERQLAAIRNKNQEKFRDRRRISRLQVQQEAGPQSVRASCCTPSG